MPSDDPDVHAAAAPCRSASGSEEPGEAPTVVGDARGAEAPDPSQSAAAPRPLAFGISRDELRRLAEELGEPGYRGDQLFRWIWRRRELCLDRMTDLPKRFRVRLAKRLDLALPEIRRESISRDGTQKLLVQLRDGCTVECVLIPDAERLTLCVSTQVGCALACRFCATGAMGFTRNLTAGEIAAQLLLADRSAREAGHAPPASDRPTVTNVVLMGMGEPLLNPRACREAIGIWRDRQGLDFSPDRITVSTVGVLRNLWGFLDETGVGLAVSLHAPTSKVRAEIMPIEQTYPVEELLSELRRRQAERRSGRVTFEYVLLAGVNDQDEDARALALRIRGIRAKVNLLPFNPFPGARYDRPSDERVDAFRRALLAEDVDAYVRRSRGRDIQAACGQLAAE